jgi:hypothetical protein
MPSTESQTSQNDPGAVRWLRRLALFPFLLPVFFVLHIARYFYGGVKITDALEMTGVYAAMTGGAFLALRPLIRNKPARGIAVFMLIGLWLYWADIIHFSLRLFHLGDNYGYYPFIVFAYGISIVLLCRLVSRLNSRTASALVYYLNVLFIIFIAVELGYIGFYAYTGTGKKPVMAANPDERNMDQSAKAGGNIYLLLFDEYASSASLKEDLGFDNAGMDSFLKRRGFFVNEKSRSNYWWTQFSMASLLNMDYFNDFRKPYNYCSDPQQLQPMRAIENARVAAILQHAGCSLKSYSIFDLADQPKKDIIDRLPTGTRLITVHTFYHLLVKDYLPYIRHRSAMKKEPAYRYPPFYEMDDYNNKGIQFVLQEARRHEGKPSFVYAHFMMPHGTYYYDSADRIMPMDQIKAITPAEESRYYRYNVRHTNKKLQQMIDAIQQNDTGATIIVLGDHGYRYDVADGWHPQYFRNMSALYFPDRNYASLPDSFTNVNVFRIVLNKVCGTHYPLLEDKCYTLARKRN